MTRSAPIHNTAMLEKLTIKPTVGNIDDISRPERNETSVKPALASAKRSVSCGSRTNARTTRMPLICSRRTELMRSIRICIA